MTDETRNLEALSRSLMTFEDEYIELIYTWECYKNIHTEYAGLQKNLYTEIEFTMDIIAGSLLRSSWACMMRIWDQKNEPHNNIHMSLVYNVINSLKKPLYEMDRKEFCSLKKTIRSLYLQNKPMADKVRKIRNNHLSHKNVGNSDDIEKYPIGTRLDKLYPNHTIEEFDELYTNTEIIITSLFNIFGRRTNFEPARKASVDGSKQLIQKITGN